jgi:hypothetical protein
MSNAHRSLDASVISELFELARPYYDEKSPYHNLGGHIVSAAENAVFICEDLANVGVSTNMLDVVAAMVCHDTLEGDGLEGTEYKTPEQRSAGICGNMLTGLGVLPKRIHNVLSIIQATSPLCDPTTNDQKAGRLADLSNVGGEWYECMRNSGLIILEKIQRGEELNNSFEAHCVNTSNFLRSLIFPALTFNGLGRTDIAFPRSDDFLTNIDRLAQLSFQELVESTGFDFHGVPENWQN